MRQCGGRNRNISFFQLTELDETEGRATERRRCVGAELRNAIGKPSADRYPEVVCHVAGIEG